MPLDSNVAVMPVMEAFSHVQLPKLHDADVIEFSREEEVVSLADRATPVLSIIKCVEGSGAFPTRDRPHQTLRGNGERFGEIKRSMTRKMDYGPTNPETNPPGWGEVKYGGL